MVDDVTSAYMSTLDDMCARQVSHVRVSLTHTHVISILVVKHHVEGHELITEDHTCYIYIIFL